MAMEQSAQKIFFITPIENVLEDTRDAMNSFALERELAGDVVNWPLRDTNQRGIATNLCVARDNREVLAQSDLVYIYYAPFRTEITFYLAMAIVFKKDLYVVNPEDVASAPKTEPVAYLIRELISAEKIRNVPPSDDLRHWLTLNNKPSPIARMLMQSTMAPVFWLGLDDQDPEQMFHFGGLFAHMREDPKQVKLLKGHFAELILELVAFTQDGRRTI